MKRIRKAAALLLVLALLLSLCAVTTFADDARELSMLCYNVAGLPSIGKLIGMEGADVPGNQRSLGKQLNRSGYDVIAVQEDFGYHALLSGGLTAYSYKTAHTGGIPGGDGMNVFSKLPLGNVKRTAWNSAYGVINDGADELTPKGILYTVLDLGGGITVDFYVIHADAYDGEGSTAARNDNFRQLAALIEARGTDRPVIVTGDFNTSAHIYNGDVFLDALIDGCGLKDAWIELHNDGKYTDFSAYSGSYWGVWDSVEKFLYRDGGGVHIEALSFEYVDYLNGGRSVSDHKAASATFRFTKTGSFAPVPGVLCPSLPNPLGVLVRKAVTTVRDLYKIFTHFDDLLAYLK